MSPPSVVRGVRGRAARRLGTESDQAERRAGGKAIPSTGEVRGVLGSRFNNPESSPGFLLWQVATLWQRAVRGALEEVGLTHAQFALLASAAWLGGVASEPVTQTHVAQHARTDAVMTSEVLRTLERKGLVSRLPHPDDARARRIVLSAAGVATVRRAVALVEAVDEAFFGAPSPELRLLARLLAPEGASNS